MAIHTVQTMQQTAASVLVPPSPQSLGLEPPTLGAIHLHRARASRFKEERRALSFPRSKTGPIAVRAVASPAATTADAATVATWNEEARLSRLDHLETQALAALKNVIEGPFASPAFPCALIAGDVVLLHLLHRLGALENGRVKVIFIDTFHLFPETHAFLRQCEERYGFQAQVFQAAGSSEPGREREDRVWDPCGGLQGTCCLLLSHTAIIISDASCFVPYTTIIFSHPILSPRSTFIPTKPSCVC